MLNMVRGRGNGLAAGFLSMAMLASIAVMAVRSPGFEETQVDLHESGVWVVKRGSIARFNLEINEFEAHAPLSSPEEDIVQDARDLVTFAPSALARIDPVAHRRSDSVEAPESVQVDVRGGTGVVLDPVSGALWRQDAAVLGSQQVTDVEQALVAPADGPGHSVVAVGQDGRVHVYRAGEAAVRSYEPHGGVEPPTETSIGKPIERPQITTVGDQVVLLDTTDGRVVVPGGPTVHLEELAGATDLQLQLSGPASSHVLIAGGGRLVEAGLVGGQMRTIASDGGGGAVRPVRARGCAFAAFGELARWARTCEDREEVLESVETESIPGIEPGQGSLQFRENRGRVVLNEVDEGMVVTVGSPLVEDFAWDEPDPQADEVEPEELPDEVDDACGEDGADPPEVNPDGVGTRPGRAVVVDVLRNDRIDDCDVARVQVPRPPAADVADVDVVSGGTALQVTPRVESGTVRVDYVVVTTTGEVATSLTVQVVAGTANSAPQAEHDTTYSAVDRTLTYNVLLNDSDPEGDVLSLVSVDPHGSAPAVQFRPDGTVIHRAGGAAETHRYSYTVRDSFGGEDREGILDIQIRAERAQPETRGDFLRVRVGGRATVDVLANDTDADTDHDKLQLLGVDSHPASLGLTWTEEGTVTVSEPGQVGPHTLTYRMGDGEGEPVLGTLLVLVEPADDQNAPPVAVRDVARVRPNVPTLVDVLANDVDRDGDVLAVTEVQAPADAPFAVEVLDMRVLRLTAAEGFSEEWPVRYTLSDGSTSEDQGVLLVVPHEQWGHNQAPVANPDEVEVRAGRWTSVSVLRNDSDPEGEHITLTRVEVVGRDGVEPRALADAFVQGDQVRLRIEEGVQGSVELVYTVEDPEPNPNTGRIQVRVRPESEENQPPDAVQLEARVFSGDEVVIPLSPVGMDPDGDVVAIKGVLPSNPPDLGDVSRHARGLVYRADRGASGRDSFGFVLTDGTVEQPGSTVRVVVVPRPDTQYPPVAVPDEVTLKVGTARSIDVLANDTDPEGERPTLVDEGASVVPSTDGGTVRTDRGMLWYEAPPSLPAGQDSRWVNLTYQISDSAGNRAEGLVRVRLLPADSEVRVPPVALDDTAPLTTFGTVVDDMDLLQNDYDPDDPDRSNLELAAVAPLSGPDWSIETSPSGRVVVRAGQTPIVAKYTVRDADGNSADALLTVPVVASLPPVAVLDDQYEVAVGGEVRIPVLANDENSPGKPRSELDLVSVRGRSRGTPEMAGDEVVYRPGDGGAGEGGFSYVIQNREGEQAVGRVRVRIVAAEGETEQNTPPVFLRPTRQVVEAGGEALVLDLSRFARDDDDDPLTFTVVSETPEHLEATLQRGSTLRISAMPSAPDLSTNVRITIDDGNHPPVSGVIEVQIRADAGPPVAAARADRGEMRAGDPGEFRVLENDGPFDHPEQEPAVVGVQLLQGAGQPAVGCGGTCVTYSATPEDAARPVRIRYTMTDGWAPDGGSASPDRQRDAELFITVFGRPGRPGTPSGQERSRAVLVAWGAASSNGLPVTGYRLEVQSTDGGAVPSRFADVQGGTQTDVTGLENGRTYRFRVAAINREFGVDHLSEESWSPWSPGYTPDAVPGAPVAVEARFDETDNAGGAGGVLHVSWSPPPVNDGSPILHYWVSSNQGHREQVPAGTTTLPFNNLVNGSPYTFTVVAENAKGPSEPSAPSNTESPTGVPGAPTTVTGVRRAPQTASDAFVAVTFGAGPDNGGTQTFTVAARGSGAPPPRENVVSGVEVGPLTGGESYTFEVVAKNRAGESPPAVSAPVTAYGRPDAPAAPSVVPGDGNVSVSWRAPAATGGGDVTYTVTRNPGGVIESGFTGITLVDDGADNDQAYTYTVFATNGGGYEGPASAPSPTAIPYGAPDVRSRIENQTTVVFYWDQQPGVDRYTANLGEMSGCCEARYQAGPGEPRTFQATITAHGPGEARSRTVTSQATADTRSITIRDGGSAAGQIDIVGGQPCTSVCRWIEVHMTGFQPGQSYSGACWGDDQFVSAYKDFGPVTAGPDGSVPVFEPCFYGYPNNNAWVVVDGVESNRFSP